MREFVYWIVPAWATLVFLNVVITFILWFRGRNRK